MKFWKQVMGNKLRSSRPGPRIRNPKAFSGEWWPGSQGGVLIEREKYATDGPGSSTQRRLSGLMLSPGVSRVGKRPPVIRASSLLPSTSGVGLDLSSFDEAYGLSKDRSNAEQGDDRVTVEGPQLSNVAALTAELFLVPCCRKAFQPQVCRTIPSCSGQDGNRAVVPEI